MDLQDKGLLKNLRGFLSSFSCKQDKDIEIFLHNRAVDFERISKSRTFLICKKEEKSKRMLILAYFSLALKALHIPDDMSIQNRKKLDGFRGKLHNKPISEIPCFLIGQLGKNSNLDKSSINGNDILEHAYSVIRSASFSVGGRWILVECHETPKIINFYLKNDFEYFMKKPDGVIPMVQMIRPIYNEKPSSF